MEHERHGYVLVDHGSRREHANALLEEIATLMSERLGPGAIVEAAHMEIATPTLADAFAKCVARGATKIVVHPFMLAPGKHVREDLPRLAADAANAHRGVAFVLAEPLGKHDGVIDAVMDRCHAALTASEA